MIEKEREAAQMKKTEIAYRKRALREQVELIEQEQINRKRKIPKCEYDEINWRVSRLRKVLDRIKNQQEHQECLDLIKRAESLTSN